ncbi:hypothetical protein A2164_01055 [Candidatus Curtissbacteria bacterium RBG_13_35_7]|uniref:Regulatory protein RecX n=1 Tax=Candidatus Curtissbacteria bacterium RBG_13_35_7 TaxID=1797705 RepID=A0A1F5G0P7_9BACT|nr:MAG: hypothetical protein A2164_01055 [Candidatus Curtissbacteria bacterium RBG_13_35_7]
MPQITSIEPQKKNKDRFNIFIDGKFAFGNNMENLIKNQLKVGVNLNIKSIQKIIQKEEISKLTDSSLNFLSFRPRSQQEIKVYLTKKISKNENLPYHQAKESPLIEQIITKLKKYKYINDLEFTTWWIKSRNRSNPKGRFQIKAELIKKGINRDLIEQVLAKYSNQTVLAKKAIEKKLTVWKNLSGNELKKKVYAYLSTRGFDFDTISHIVAYLEKKR